MIWNVDWCHTMKTDMKQLYILTLMAPTRPHFFITIDGRERQRKQRYRPWHFFFFVLCIISPYDHLWRTVAHHVEGMSDRELPKPPRKNILPTGRSLRRRPPRRQMLPIGGIFVARFSLRLFAIVPKSDIGGKGFLIGQIVLKTNRKDEVIFCLFALCWHSLWRQRMPMWREGGTYYPTQTDTQTENLQSTGLLRRFQIDKHLRILYVLFRLKIMIHMASNVVGIYTPAHHLIMYKFIS